MTERILICTLGETPQVVTETVWALRQGPAPWVPTRVEIITTAHGIKRVSIALQGPSSRLAELFPEGCPPVAIYVPLDEEDTPPLALIWAGGTAPRPSLEDINLAHAISDVATAEEAQVMGEVIKDRIWAAIEDGDGPRDTELHVSLAGGRKTMSAHALLALGLLGRVQDEASHVLVSPKAFEGNDQFWHRDQATLINTREEIAAHRFGNQVLPPPSCDPKGATIALVRVPTPLVAEMPDNERRAMGQLRLSQIIDQISLANRFRRQPNVTFSDQSNEVRIGDRRARLRPWLYAQLRFLSCARQESWPGAGPGGYAGHSGWITAESLAHVQDKGGRLAPDLLLEILRRAIEVDGGVVEQHKPGQFTPTSYDSLHKARSLARASQSNTPEAVKARIGYIFEMKAWFGSLTKLRQALVEQFGAPLTNHLIPRVLPPDKTELETVKRSKKKGPPTRFGLLCPPEAIRTENEFGPI